MTNNAPIVVSLLQVARQLQSKEKSQSNLALGLQFLETK